MRLFISLLVLVGLSHASAWTIRDLQGNATDGDGNSTDTSGNTTNAPTMTPVGNGTDSAPTMAPTDFSSVSSAMEFFNGTDGDMTMGNDTEIDSNIFDHDDGSITADADETEAPRNVTLAPVAGNDTTTEEPESSSVRVFDALMTVAVAGILAVLC